MTRVLTSETTSVGYLNVQTLHLEDPKGRTFNRQVITRGHSACVLCYDPKIGQVLLTEQFRPGAYPSAGPILECIAGMLDPGEDAQASILREAQEEAGLLLSTSDLQLVGKVMLSPGVLQEMSTIYLAKTSFSNIDTQRTYGLDSEHESIRLVLMSFHQFRRYLSLDIPLAATLQLAGQALLRQLDRS